MIIKIKNICKNPGYLVTFSKSSDISLLDKMGSYRREKKGNKVNSILHTYFIHKKKWGPKLFVSHLLNIRGLSKDDTRSIIREWLYKCNQLKRLDFNPDHRIKSALYSSKNFFPISCDKLKFENEGFYKLLQERGELTK
jgi:hypothetical protein